MKLINKSLFIALSLSAISFYGFTGEAALYGASAPSDAGFFRVINLDETKKITLRDENGKSIADLLPGHGSLYAFLPEGRHHLKINEKDIDLDLKKGEQLSFIWSSDAIKKISDQPFKDKSKARVVLYNLTNNALDLTTKTGKTVVGNINSGQQAGRDVNAVTTALGIARNGSVVAATSPVSLQKGKVISLFAIDRGSPSVVVVESNR